MLHHCILLVCLPLSGVWSQLVPGTFSGFPGTGSGAVDEGFQVGFECDVTQPVSLIQIYAKINSVKITMAESYNDTNLSLYFNINRTLHNIRFSCKAFWSNGSEAYKSGEKWYKVLFAVTDISLTNSVVDNTHIFEENQVIRVTCTCNEGHPQPEIIWSRNGGMLNPDFETVEEEIEDGDLGYSRVSSTLSITTQGFMNHAVFVCQVKAKEELQQNYSIEILFPPDNNNLDILPEDSVREDQWLTITCSVDPSNPTPDLVWYLGDKKITKATSDLEIGVAASGAEQYHANGREGTVNVKVTEERAGNVIQCRVLYRNQEITSLAKSHTLQMREVSNVYIYAGAAAGGTVTLVVIITVIVVMCQRKRKNNDKKNKTKKSEEPEDKYEYIIDAFGIDGDKNAMKPTPQNMEMRGANVQAKPNDYIRESTSSLSYENWDKSLSSLDQLKLPTMVHEGTYAVVKAGSPKQGSGIYPQQYVAAKILKGHPKSYAKEIFLSQLHAMQVVKSHDNVLELLGFLNTKKQVATVTKYYEDGDLQGFLRSRDPSCNITSRDLIGMALDVANAMKFLTSHQPPFLHHQLSGSHALVGPRMLCKVTGFALEDSVQQREKLELKHKLEVDIRWKAPELLRFTSAHTVQSDVWAFGVLLYEITTFGSVPYPGLSRDAVNTFVSSGECMARPGFVSSDIYDLMKKCWSWQQYDRPSFAVLVSQLERLQVDTYQHVDVTQIFRPYISEHMHGSKRKNHENVGL